MRRRAIDTGRRGMRNSGGVGEVVVPRTIKLVDSLSNASYYQLASSSGVPGSAAMTVMTVLYCKKTSPLNADFTPITKFTNNTRGYRLRVIQGADRVVPAAVNGSATTVSETVSQAGYELGKFYTFGMRITGGLLEAFFQGSQIGAPGATLTGYTAATTADTLQVGLASAAANWALAAVVVADTTAVSNANITAWHAQVAASNSFSFPGGGTTALWYAGDADAGAGVAAATWTDSVGGIVLAKAATPTITTITSPVFA